MAQPDPLRQEIRAYYRRLAPYLEEDLGAREDAALWRWVAARWKGARVLEVGAGTGRVTRILATTARRVVAFDVSLDLLSRATRGLGPDARIWPILADARGLSLAAEFDLVVAADDPFSHLVADDDRARAVQAVADHLAPGGAFLLDALWLPADELRAAASPEGRQRTRRVPRRRGDLTIRESWCCDPASLVCSARYEYRRGAVVEASAEFQARCWSLEEVERRFAAAGLAVTGMWGDYARTPFRAESATHLVIASRRSVPSGPATPERVTGR